MKRSDELWKSADLAKSFLEGVRGAIPLAAEQLDVLVRLVERARPKLNNFLDLGCGDGILGCMLLKKFPNAHGIFADFSPPMLQAAKARCPMATHQKFIEMDYGVPEWVRTIETDAPFDAIVSGFSIHHQPDARKKELYREIFGLLKPGGIFLNLEHVSSATPWVSQTFDELFVDGLFAFHQSTGGKKSKEVVAREYYYRPDKAANILSPAEVQCQWLREIGYENVDVYLKIFELALFGGIRS